MVMRYYRIIMAYKPVVLVVLDGVGARLPGVAGHPYAEAKLPAFREFEQWYPFSTLSASGIAVGLPWGEEGNSEVGHLTMGAGRVIFNHLPRIISSIGDGTFFENEALKKAAEHVKQRNSTFHLMGLFSSGSVHAYMSHVYALLDFTERQGVERIVVHPFTDGRDAPVDEGVRVLAELSVEIKDRFPHAGIGSVIGRHFAMDRDGNWDRTEHAYRLLVEGVGNPFTDAAVYAQDSYKKGVTDEFIEPGYATGEDGAPRGRMREGDAIVYWDFREDSARQLTAAFTEESFSHFPRKKLADICFVTMTEYGKAFPAEVAFPPIEISWPLSRVIAEASKKQLHVAETEKYAHVTYFFNGGREDAYSGEERVLVQSPPAKSFKDDPEMAASKVTEAVLAGIPAYDFIIANYANGDMVGHTGNFKATVKALEVLDRELRKVADAVDAAGGVLLVTADHGNAEEKIYLGSGEPRTKHTINPVPFFIIEKKYRRSAARSDREIAAEYRKTIGVLTDVAPTVLELMDIEKPGEMTGVSLVDTISRSSA